MSARTAEMLAYARAQRMYPRSAPFRSAYMKGVRAATLELPRSACPYTADATWSRTFRKAWMRGYESVPRKVE